MGILPLRFAAGQNAASLGLSGRERYSIEGVEAALSAGRPVTVRVEDDAGARSFEATALVAGPSDVAVYRAGGILPAMLAGLVAGRGA
jgi:aconitate hydratase